MEQINIAYHACDRRYLIMNKFDKDYSDMTESEKIEFFNEASDKTLLIMILDTLQKIRKQP